MKKQLVTILVFILLATTLFSAANAGESRADDETPQTATEVFFGDVKIDTVNETDVSDWYKIDLRAGAVVTLNLTVPVTGDFDLYLYDSEGNDADWSEKEEMGGYEEIVFAVPEPGWYYINCTAFDGNGSYTLRVDGVNPPDDDNYSGNATELTVGVSKTSTMSVGSVDLQDWYKVNITKGDHITVNMTVPVSADYDLDVFDPNMLFINDSYSWDLGGYEEVSFVAEETGYHFIYCTAFEGSGSYTLVVTRNLPPVIDSFVPDAANVTIDEGDTAAFEVTVTDENMAGLLYEWRIDGIVAVNETLDNFEFVSAFVGDFSAGEYNISVSVTDDILEMDTHVWHLTVLNVNQVPVLDEYIPNSTNVTIYEGESVSFNVNTSDVDGVAPLMQWLVDGAVIDNETANDFLFTTDFDMAGNYEIRVNVTDAENASIVVFMEWDVTVLNTDRPPQFIVTGDTALEIDEGNWVNFYVNASDPDNDVISYGWYFDGVILTGETGDNYTYTSDFDSADGNVHTVMVELTSGEFTVNHTWTLTVKNVNRQPLIDNTTLKPTADMVLEDGKEIEFFVAATDPDNDAITYTWFINETSETFKNQSFNHTLAAGTYDILITATDSNGGVHTYRLSLLVNEAQEVGDEEESETSFILLVIIAIVVVVIVIIIIVVLKKKD